MSEETYIKIAIKTGEVILGYKNTMKALRNNKAKMIVTANNCPNDLKDELDRLCKFGDIRNRTVNKTSWDLGFICGRPHMVAVMAVINPGDSDILNY